MEIKTLTQSLAGETNIYYRQAGQSSADLAAFNLSSPKINREAIYDFLLYGTVLPPGTILSEVNSFFPGEALTFINEEIKKENKLYKNLARLSVENRELDYFVDQLDILLQAYFYEKKSSGYKINLFLSGGVDSGILASYLRPDDFCATWAGWGETTTDYLWAQKIAKNFNLKNHLVVYPNYDQDEKIFAELVKKNLEPFRLTALPYYRLAQKLQTAAGGNLLCLTGDNADTVAGSFGEVVTTYKLSRFNKFIKIFPWRWFYNHYRKLFLLSTDNPLALAAWLHSNGLFPGAWLKLPKNYFIRKKAQIETELGQKINKFNDYILMSMLATGVVRQMSGLRSIIYRDIGVPFGLPYCDQRIVELFLKVPGHIRQSDNFGKIILKKLALKRGLPTEIIERSKKGMSYGYKEYLKQKKHLPIWDAMIKNKLLNEFIDIKMIRRQRQDEFAAFDALRSTHYYLQKFL